MQLRTPSGRTDPMSSTSLHGVNWDHLTRRRSALTLQTMMLASPPKLQGRDVTHNLGLLGSKMAHLLWPAALMANPTRTHRTRSPPPSPACVGASADDSGLGSRAEGAPLSAGGAPSMAMRAEGANARRSARREEDARAEISTHRHEHPSLWRRAERSTNNKLKARS